MFEIVCRTLLERFGQKIGDQPSTVGVPDERGDINEDDEIEEVAPPGREKVNPWAVAWAAEKKGHKRSD